MNCIKFSVIDRLIDLFNLITVNYNVHGTLNTKLKIGNFRHVFQPVAYCEKTKLKTHMHHYTSKLNEAIVMVAIARNGSLSRI